MFFGNYESFSQTYSFTSEICVTEHSNEFTVHTPLSNNITVLDAGMFGADSHSVQ